jgi:hypothetical protein
MQHSSFSAAVFAVVFAVAYSTSAYNLAPEVIVAVILSGYSTILRIITGHFPAAAFTFPLDVVASVCTCTSIALLFHALHAYNMSAFASYETAAASLLFGATLVVMFASFVYRHYTTQN